MAAANPKRERPAPPAVKPEHGRDYVARLGITRPRVEDLVGRRDVKLFHLMVIALLEHGGPMPLEEITQRLERAGVRPDRGELNRSLLKAWHGLAPVHRDPAGRFGLDLFSRELDFLLLVTGLRPPRFSPAADPPVEPPPIPPVDDNVPLSPAEVENAFRGRYLASVSSLRQAAAVLDAAGRPLDVAEVEALLARLTPHRSRITANVAQYWRSPMITADAQGRLALDRTAPGVAELRRAVRALVARAAQERAREERFERVRAESDAWRAAEMELARAHASVARRAILHAVPSTTAPEAVGLLDVESRAIQTFIASEFDDLRKALAGYQVLAAIQIRDLLHTLGHDADACQVIDLGPPQKTVRLNRRGRVLKLTAPLLITGTTGQSRPLGEPSQIRHYLAAGDHGKLRRRLEADLKALYAFYRYGRLHGYVRLRWGFLDDRLPVDWALRGDAGLYQILEDALRHGQPVDVVFSPAPGWRDPWARAHRVEVLRIDYNGGVALRDGAGMLFVDQADIQAARPVRRS